MSQLYNNTQNTIETIYFLKCDFLPLSGKTMCKNSIMSMKGFQRNNIMTH